MLKFLPDKSIPSTFSYHVSTSPHADATVLVENSKVRIGKPWPFGKRDASDGGNSAPHDIDVVYDVGRGTTRIRALGVVRGLWRYGVSAAALLLCGLVVYGTVIAQPTFGADGVRALPRGGVSAMTETAASTVSVADPAVPLASADESAARGDGVLYPTATQQVMHNAADAFGDRYTDASRRTALAGDALMAIANRPLAANGASAPGGASLGDASGGELMEPYTPTGEKAEQAYAYGLYIGDKYIGSAYSMSEVNNAIELMNIWYRVTYGISETGVIEFVDGARIEYGIRNVKDVTDTAGLIKVLSQTSQAAQYYAVKEGDTLWDIAAQFDISLDELLANNVDTDDVLNIGDELVVTREVPMFAMKSTDTYTVERELTYEVEKIPTDELYVGEVEIVKAGMLGAVRVTETVETVGGEVTNTVVHEQQVLRQPQREVARVGTQPIQQVGNGIFYRPVAGGYVSSAFGARGGGLHTGIDWALNEGTRINAADNGVVTFAGWGGNYGHLVKVDHRNGYVTYYAHCSKLLVSEGQEVVAGQQIALVGNTGNSTGPHLHFEVRDAGVPKNPAEYIVASN